MTAAQAGTDHAKAELRLAKVAVASGKVDVGPAKAVTVSAKADVIPAKAATVSAKAAAGCAGAVADSVEGPSRWRKPADPRREMSPGLRQVLGKESFGGNGPHSGACQPSPVGNRCHTWRGAAAAGRDACPTGPTDSLCDS